MPAPASGAALDRSAFFDAIRTEEYARDRRLFPRGLTQAQVDGISRLLDVWEAHYAKREGFTRLILAYNLATSYHETAHTMQPITERGGRSYFNKYEPGTRLGKVLGNTQPGDGFRFRGEGDVQNTGRRNAVRATEELHKIGVLPKSKSLVDTPSLRGDPIVSAHSLFLGNQQGWWTGRGLPRYIGGTKRGLYNARRVVNGVDKAHHIAACARAFERALIAAGYPAPEATRGALAPVLRKGSTGPDVERWQRAARASGDYTGKIDGDFGPMTDRATRAFQARYGLSVDGIVGAETWRIAQKMGHDA